MASPVIKIIALSNVFSRIMNFRNKGDVEQGHKHTYDHATLVSSGSVLVEILNEDDTTKSSKEFQAPTMIYISKDNRHRITALQDHTVCSCIHALRTIDEDIIDPDFLIEPIEARRLNSWEEVSWYKDISDKIVDETGKKMKPFVA